MSRRSWHEEIGFYFFVSIYEKRVRRNLKELNIIRANLWNSDWYHSMSDITIATLEGELSLMTREKHLLWQRDTPLITERHISYNRDTPTSLWHQNSTDMLCEQCHTYYDIIINRVHIRHYEETLSFRCG